MCNKIQIRLFLNKSVFYCKLLYAFVFTKESNLTNSAIGLFLKFKFPNIKALLLISTLV